MAIVLIGFFFRTFQLAHTPPGLTWDEGAEGLDAADLFHGRWAVFFPSNSGHEPAMAYVHAAALKAFGWTSFAMRLPNAFFTTLAVAATFLVARRLFGWRVAWLAAFLEATAFWQVAINRMATRQPMLTIFGLLTVYCLVRWLDGQRPWRSAALCGLCAGLALYVYTPARFLPLVVLVAWLAALLAAKKRGRLVGQGALCAAVAGAVFAPLGVYFLQHPADFSMRSSQISIFNPSLGPVWLNALGAIKVAGLMFAVDGEPGWDRDIAHLPLFDPVLAALFVAGLVLALWRWRRPAYLLALAWLAIMLLPMVLTSPSWPDFGRAIGIAPVVFFFPALAAAALWRRWPATRWLLAAGALALVGVTSWQYFAVWANAEGTQLSYRPAVLGQAQAAAGRLLAANAPSAVYLGAPDDHDAVTDFVIAGLDAEHPTVASRLIGYDARYTTVLPPSGSESYVAGASSPTVTALPALGGRLDASFGNMLLHFDAYDLPPSVAPGGTLNFQAEWQPLARWDQPVTLFAHLLDYSQQRAVASFDHNGFPAGEWRGGERVLSRFPLEIPAATPNGAYWIEAGAYTSGGQRLKTSEGHDRLLLGPVVVAPSNSSNQEPVARLGPDVSLLPSGITRDGASLDVALRWLPTGSVQQDYSVFVHVVDSGGKLVAQADGPPAGGQWPTRYWRAGTPVDDGRTVALPAGLPAGQYDVTAGLYRLDTGERLPASPAGPEPGSALVGSVHIG